MAASHHPDLILMDLGLPDQDGLELTRRLREWCAVPIIVVSARGLEQDKIQALDAGADDYLTKPFGIGELLARIRVALRHVHRGRRRGRDAGVRAGRLAHRPGPPGGDRGRPAGAPHPQRIQAAHHPGSHAGLVLTHHQLLKEVWGGAQGAQPHYLRVYMAQLRQKLEADPARPQHLITEPGVGYRLRME